MGPVDSSRGVQEGGLCGWFSRFCGGIHQNRSADENGKMWFHGQQTANPGLGPDRPDLDEAAIASAGGCPGSQTCVATLEEAQDAHQPEALAENPPGELLATVGERPSSAARWQLAGLVPTEFPQADFDDDFEGEEDDLDDDEDNENEDDENEDDDAFD